MKTETEAVVELLGLEKAAAQLVARANKPFRLRTGHVCRPKLYLTGSCLVEEEPRSGIFLFSFDPLAQEIIAEHKRRQDADVAELLIQRT